MASKVASSKALFACTRCHNRYAFEDLSADKQQCKKCRTAYIVVKCLYCCAEFESSGENSRAICTVCEQNVKQFGKPKNCEYCSLLAAFKTSVCRRCHHYSKRFGHPVPCQQCKKTAAFDRKDGNTAYDGQHLCWQCAQTYRSSKLKARKAKSLSDKQQARSRQNDEPDIKRNKLSTPSGGVAGGTSGNPDNSTASPLTAAGARGENSPASTTSPSFLTPGMSPLSYGNTKSMESSTSTNSGEQFLLVSELKERIMQLERQSILKDQQLLAKDKQIAELRALTAKVEKDSRTKTTALQKQNSDLMEQLVSKNREINSLAKANRSAAGSSGTSNGKTQTKQANLLGGLIPT